MRSRGGASRSAGATERDGEREECNGATQEQGEQCYRAWPGETQGNWWTISGTRGRIRRWQGNPRPGPSKARCPTSECSPASTWVKADRLHPLIPRESELEARAVPLAA